MHVWPHRSPSNEINPQSVHCAVKAHVCCTDRYRRLCSVDSIGLDSTVVDSADSASLRLFSVGSPGVVGSPDDTVVALVDSACAAVALRSIVLERLVTLGVGKSPNYSSVLNKVSNFVL